MVAMTQTPIGTCSSLLPTLLNVSWTLSAQIALVSEGLKPPRADTEVPGQAMARTLPQNQPSGLRARRGGENEKTDNERRRDDDGRA